MRLQPLYRATFTTPEAWSAELAGPARTEGQSFLIAEGRCEGRLPGRLRGANYPRRRTGNALLPDFRGVLQGVSVVLGKFPTDTSDLPSESV